MGNTTYPDLARVDAADKVRGATRYGADDARPGLLHAVLASSAGGVRGWRCGRAYAPAGAGPF